MILNSANDIQSGANKTDSAYIGSNIVWKRSNIEPYSPISGERHYGIKFRGGANNIYEYEYLYDAAGKQPATYDATTGNVNLGGWSTAFFITNNYPCMLNFDGTEAYRLNPNDFSKKEDGTTSDYNNINFDGNAMSCFNCHIWIKCYYQDGWCYIEVSDRKLDNDFVDYPYIQSNGVHSNRIYYPMYSGIMDSSNRLRSIASGDMRSLIDTHSNLVSAASRNGKRWQIRSFAFMSWINSLILMMFRGLGVLNLGSTDKIYQNGVSYNKGQFSYKTVSNSYVHNTFFCEWLWCSRIWTSRDDLVYDVYNGMYYKIDEETVSGRTYDSPFIYYKMYPPYIVLDVPYPYSSETELPGYHKIRSSNNLENWTMSKDFCYLPDTYGEIENIKIPTGNSPYFYEKDVTPNMAMTPCVSFNKKTRYVRLYPLTSSVFYV